MIAMIQVRQLSKRYMLYDRPLDRLADWLLPAALHRGHPFWALREMTFDVAAGSSVGIIGVNGAGKSTLLKILTGTTRPTSGDYRIQGRVSSLLELGTGFHPEFTGRQNIQFGAKMAGLTDAELAERYDGIVEFAELGDFIDQPVRTYSSGMLLRLGFALASSVDPDVLIIDEALSVGDLHFQQKCLRRIREFHERGTTVLFVSHDPSMIQNFCNEAILLDEGRMIDRGKPDQVIDYYTALLAEKYRDGGAGVRIVRPRDDAPATDTAQAAEGPAPDAAADQNGWKTPPLHARGHRTGNFRAMITSVWLEARAVHGNSQIVVTGTPAVLHVRWIAREPIPSATVGIMLRDRLGQEIFGVNSHYREVRMGPFQPGESVDVGFRMPINLGEGLYSITAAVHEGENHIETCYDWVEHAFSLQVLPNPEERFTGLCRLPVEIEVQREPTPPAERQFAEWVRSRLAT